MEVVAQQFKPVIGKWKKEKILSLLRIEKAVLKGVNIKNASRLLVNIRGVDIVLDVKRTIINLEYPHLEKPIRVDSYSKLMDVLKEN